LMEAADDICYASIDLEDGIEMGFLTYDEVIDILKVVVDFNEIPPLHPHCEGDDLLRLKITIARGKAMNTLIEGIVDTFIEHKDNLLNGNLMDEDLIGACGGRVKEFIDLAKNTAREKIFNNTHKMQLEIGSHATIEILLDSLIKATYAKHTQVRLFSKRSQKILNLMGSHQPKKDWSLEHSYLHVLDFISGMTDKYAINVAKQIAAMKE
ncbi:MAG: deoxyguanosinetriphosphate triphosphohydrolase, partial [Chamaesiphon sp.]|nr:deoxyguanosinetriphosphate triphosphohydrolase [Chamaesiphon sp.]